MALAVVFIVIGILFGGNGLLISAGGASQQTVQYLSFVCAALFIVGGFIAIELIISQEYLKAIKRILEKGKSGNIAKDVSKLPSPIEDIDKNKQIDAENKQEG